ncbi:hypothetical protein VE25_06845 [Devosia geojensis]|uniref:HpcH/HpaI aldolase/citrate lyase domain-containing protein n=1 Tax=Devosia geojensis TaxID=443610 RepID=A0A0F5FWS5_9HYPH|nr:aldolase/citrate lyase family protein [Devosia geojensis]KKB12622.1 hypothetical protein VE25_06845 [Devosia geojensis]
MNRLPNRFKQGLLARRRQIGAWLTSGSPTITEVFSGSGFDWLLVDMEHSPNDLLQVVDHLRAAGQRSEIIVRVPWNEPVVVKRLLDAGVTSLMFPYVQSGEEARAAVAATRYPPHGIRGVAGTTRATDYGRRVRFASASEEIAVVVQLETPAAIQACGEIAAVDGIDGVFIGPNDLAANMGHLGDANHPDVRAAMIEGARIIAAAGKSPGTLAYVPDKVASPFAEGFDFVGAAFDIGILVRGASQVQADYARLRELED